MTQVGRRIGTMVAPLLDPNGKQSKHRTTVLSRFLLVMVAFNVYRMALVGLNDFLGLDYCGGKVEQSFEPVALEDEL